MSNPPPLPPLNYQTPPPSSSQPNRPWKVMLRIVAGCGAGIACCVAGMFLAGALNNGWWFFLPLALALGAAGFVAIKYRRFGYVTGLLMGPFVVVAGLFLLLMIVCGLGPFKH